MIDLSDGVTRVVGEFIPTSRYPMVEWNEWVIENLQLRPSDVMGFEFRLGGAITSENIQRWHQDNIIGSFSHMFLVWSDEAQTLFKPSLAVAPKPFEVVAVNNVTHQHRKPPYITSSRQFARAFLPNWVTWTPKLR